jgi:hypothetical protein
LRRFRPTPAQICGDLSRFPAIQALVPETSKAYRSLAKPLENVKAPQSEAFAGGVSDGTRTRDHLDHNQELYQLSYAHQVRRAV